MTKVSSLNRNGKRRVLGTSGSNHMVIKLWINEDFASLHKFSKLCLTIEADIRVPPDVVLNIYNI